MVPYVAGREPHNQERHIESSSCRKNGLQIESDRNSICEFVETPLEEHNGNRQIQTQYRNTGQFLKIIICWVRWTLPMENAGWQKHSASTRIKTDQPNSFAFTHVQINKLKVSLSTFFSQERM